MSTTTDDATLLRVLAEACGWQCIPPTPPDGIYEIRDRDGGWIAQSSTEKWAWQNAYRKLACLHSVDAALALPWPEEGDKPGEYYELHIRTSSHSSDVRLEHHVINSQGETDIITIGYAYAPNKAALARALCEVFAQWATERKHE